MILVLAFVFWPALFSCCLAFASPSVPDVGVYAGEGTPAFVPATLASPISVALENSTVQTADGQMIQSCVLTFIPDGQGVKTIERCTMSAVESPDTPGLLPSSTPSVATVPSPSKIVAAAGTAFTIPGRTLEVLPVGLCVYSGVTAITFMVVAFVTYERVQYREAFRQRKMTERIRLSNELDKFNMSGGRYI